MTKQFKLAFLAVAFSATTLFGGYAAGGGSAPGVGAISIGSQIAQPYTTIIGYTDGTGGATAGYGTSIGYNSISGQYGFSDRNAKILSRKYHKTKKT